MGAYAPIFYYISIEYSTTKIINNAKIEILEYKKR